MKKLRLTVDNSNEIRNRLWEYQGKRQNNIFRALDILEFADLAETKFGELGIPKGKRKGAIYKIGAGAGASALSYNYGINTTVATLERGASHWFLINLETEKMFPQQRRINNWWLTPEQDRIAVDALRKGYSVQGVRFSLRTETGSFRAEGLPSEAACSAVCDALYEDASYINENWIMTDPAGRVMHRVDEVA